jgi:hypothetical protein
MKNKNYELTSIRPYQTAVQLRSNQLTNWLVPSSTSYVDWFGF